jgi:hypothetical protein
MRSIALALLLLGLAACQASAPPSPGDSEAKLRAHHRLPSRSDPVQPQDPNWKPGPAFTPYQDQDN